MTVKLSKFNKVTVFNCVWRTYSLDTKVPCFRYPDKTLFLAADRNVILNNNNKKIKNNNNHKIKKNLRKDIFTICRLTLSTDLKVKLIKSIKIIFNVNKKIKKIIIKPTDDPIFFQSR